MRGESGNGKQLYALILIEDLHVMINSSFTHDISKQHPLPGPTTWDYLKACHISERKKIYNVNTFLADTKGGMMRGEYGKEKQPYEMILIKMYIR